MKSLPNQIKAEDGSPTLEDFKNQLDDCEKKKLKEAREYSIELMDAYNGVKCNIPFEHFLIDQYNLNLKWDEPIEGTTSTVSKSNTFQIAIFEEFKKWRSEVKEHLWMNFFETEKKSIVMYDNIWELQKKHLIKYQIKGENASDYQDIELLKKPNIEKILKMLIETLTIFDLKEVAFSISNKDPHKIEKFFKHFSKEDDPFLELRSLKNTFNKMTVDELIDFFSILLKKAIGQSEPIISTNDFVQLIKSICENQLLTEPIAPNLESKDYPRLRRLFYDFFEKGRQEFVTKSDKYEYMKFAGNFKPFKEEFHKKSWIDGSTSEKQKKRLVEIILME